MKSGFKKVLSVIIIAVVIIGWFISINGAGSVKNIKDSLKYGLDINGGVYVVLEADLSGIEAAERDAVMDQTREVLNRRVNAMGISEATVSVEGDNRIRVEMPGVEDADSAIRRIGTTAKLRFTLADGTEYLSGSDIKDARASLDDRNGGYKIELEFTTEGQNKFEKATRLASSGKVTPIITVNGQKVDKTSVVIWLDNQVLTAPTCSSTIVGTSCEITRSGGGYTQTDASETAALIRGGALPVSLQEVSSSVQTASIGAGALNKSIIAGAIGLLLVFIFMIIIYKVLGAFADIALALYVLLVLWIMKALGAVLTLPGIAGIILGIGMAVDANVIIFSRIREEISNGRTVRSAVDLGFRRAVVTVLDSQITTLIAAVILYELGSTSVKGFALTLMISIVISIFTAVVVTQVFVGTLANSRKFGKNKFFGCNADGSVKKLIKKDIKFIAKRKIFFIISIVIIVAGIVTLGIRGFNYGIDFTGGTMIQMNMGQQVDIDEVQKAISEYDLDATIVYSGDNNEQIIIKTTKSLDNAERQKVATSIEKTFKLKSDSVVASEQFGPAIGKELRNNALKAIAIAAVGMLIYILLRFKSWKYGVSALLGLAHDVLIMIAIYAIFGITVNNPFVAAILTIVGYSINDTMVVFDRVRENHRLMKKEPIMERLDRSLNQTVGRSLVTSVTTILAIIPLLCFVSGEISQFVLPLLVGVIVGTYSSICLCSPVYYLFNKNTEISKYQKQQMARKRIEEKKAKKANK